MINKMKTVLEGVQTLISNVDDNLQTGLYNDLKILEENIEEYLENIEEYLENPEEANELIEAYIYFVNNVKY